ncbi:MAG: nucleoside 2-deoxyribosyltransferase [Oscillospiraceae bacterium]|nr:nucleoside 2-deoxyribosyltransferase [Oscillospiraceae bacterium]
MRPSDFDSFSLTYEGLSYVEQLEKSSPISTSAFVAMWFCDEMNHVYDNAIYPAITECGFEPFKVDNHQHNNDITDVIIAGIRECRFMVADLSGYRGGVYYEAGFARGLGKEVILTCRKDYFDGTDGKEKVHFDVNHLNIIVWENEEELRVKLINRIKATII